MADQLPPNSVSQCASGHSLGKDDVSYPTDPFNSERPRKVDCFYIKSNMSGLIMSVEDAGNIGGFNVVMMPMSGQEKDSELWFEDQKTGTIRSRLNLHCLDITEPDDSPKSRRLSDLCSTLVGEETYYPAVARTPWGDIPGKAVIDQCWYSYGGAEHSTTDFRLIAIPRPQLIHNTGSPPAGAVDAGRQLNDGCIYYIAIARSQWGRIPGKAKGNTCWYAYKGKEYSTSHFDWIARANGCSQGLGYQLINCPNRTPENAVCVVTGKKSPLYYAVAHTKWGNIPGRAVAKQCWYSYGGKEYSTADFTWITASNTKLIPNIGYPPAGAIGAGHQVDDGCTYYAAVQSFFRWTKPGKAKDNCLWYTDQKIEHETLNFFWIVTEENQPYQILRSFNGTPNCTRIACCTRVDGQVFYSAVAHTKWGDILGASTGGQCRFSYGGVGYSTAEFSWITASNTTRVRNTGYRPTGAIGAGRQWDDSCTYYLALARTEWGRILGKAKGSNCWYAHNKKEHSTSDFDWIVTVSTSVTLKPYMSGKQTQLWTRAGGRLQSRQDKNKVLQVSTGKKGSEVLSTAVTNIRKQNWSFLNAGTLACRPVIPRSHSEVKARSTSRCFFIRSKLHGKMLTVTGASQQPGTMAIVLPQESPKVDHQLWYLDDDGIIRSKMTDFCLQPNDDGICFQPYTNKTNQMWIPQGKKILLRNKRNTCLEIPPGQQQDGAKPRQFKYKGSPYQNWTILYVD